MTTNNLAIWLLCCSFLSVSSLNILVLTPFGSNSIRGTFKILCDGLLANNHQVTYVSSNDAYPPRENFTHVQAPHTALDNIDHFQIRSGLSLFKVWKKAFPLAARQMYETKDIMELWKRRQNFDAIIVNSAANEMAFPFLINVTAPFITLQPVGIDILQLAYLGNFVSPAILPSIILPYDNYMSLWERVVNTLTITVMKYSFRRSVLQPLSESLETFFPDLPDPR